MVSTQNNTVRRSKVDITGVPETMLQTLYARAKESRKPDHAIYDGKAIEIVDSLDYDFSLADKDMAMGSGVIARTIVLDKLVSEYLKKHKGAVVVNIACGLDTRCYRNEGKYKGWYNIDLPETMTVRAMALPVLCRSENALAVKAVALRLQCTVVDGLGLRDLTVRPGANLLGRCKADLY